MSEDFFSERTEQSAAKAAIVAKYFDAWSTIMTRRTRGNIAYFDLFAGPGFYGDGSPSTPILVLQKALGDEELRARLVSVFNDANAEHARLLRNAIERMDAIGLLRFTPVVSNHVIGSEIAGLFARVRMVPTLLFVDPWGYKGLSLALIASFLKDWGSDCIFFFNYPRINAGLSNPFVIEHMEALFRPGRAAHLRTRLLGLPPEERENVIVNELSVALQENGARYVLPFRFLDPRGSRPSHYLIFVSKHILGYEIMKDIMAKESSSHEGGIASFEYSAVHDPQLKLLYDYSRPLESLGQALLAHFAGRRLTMRKIFDEHNVGTPFVKKNYKDALKALEKQGFITASPPMTKRRPDTFGDNVRVRFPPRKEA